MKQVQNFGDDRNKGWCVYCGGPNETRDHVPSRVFLDDPLPSNVPVAPACTKCNNGFSVDEAYVACLIECVLAGAVDTDKIGRPKIARLLAGNPALQARLSAARQVTEAGTEFRIEQERVRAVVLKLARGHAAYELNEPQLGEPVHLVVMPLPLMGAADREIFEGQCGGFAPWPEVGSRAMNRLLMEDDCFVDGWLIVQEGRYRYQTSQEDGLQVRFVIREYLAGEVVWD